jgi:anti-sigma factor RsiW
MATMSRCPDILTLQSFVDRQLAEAPERAVVEHLAACDACAGTVAELQRACLPLCVLTEEPPTELLQRLLSAVADIEPLSALSCDEAREWVSLRLDGELSHEQAQRLEAHLCACGACYRAAQELETASDILRGTAPAMAPAGLLERVQAAAALAAPPQPARRTPWRRLGMSLAGVAAAAAVFLAIVLNLSSVNTTTNGPAVAVAPQVETVMPAPQPAAPEAPVTVAAAGPESPDTVASRRAAHVVPAPTPRTATRVTPPARRTVPVRPPDLPSAPSVVAVGHSRPVSLAAAPGTVATPPARPEASVVPPARPEVTLATLPRATEPTAARAVTADDHKPTPAVTVAAATAPAPTPGRSNWVSRPTAAEREVYRSEDPQTHLADARKALERDISEMREKGRTPSIKRWAIH